MAVETDKIAALLKQLPEELQREVRQFAESLLKRIDNGESTGNGAGSVRSFFGVWDSGDPRSAENDRIDIDLAREYLRPHKTDS
jgi:hypothetical protein